MLFRSCQREEQRHQPDCQDNGLARAIRNELARGDHRDQHQGVEERANIPPFFSCPVEKRVCHVDVLERVTLLKANRFAQQEELEESAEGQHDAHEHPETAPGNRGGA